MTTTTERLVDRQVEQVLLEAATRAPSVHNSQPWRFVVGPRRITVHADPERQLRVADAPGRALLVSCGAAVMNLRVAAEHLGFHPRVRILPAPDDPTLVATLDVDHRHDPREVAWRTSTRRSRRAGPTATRSRTAGCPSRCWPR